MVGTEEGARPGRPARPARSAAAVVVTAVAAALAALLLGEYDFSGGLPWLVGPVLGVVLAEIATVVDGERRRWLGPVAGVFAAAALLWASYIATGEGLEPLPGSVWPAMAITVVAAVVWIGGLPRPTRRRR